MGITQIVFAYLLIRTVVNNPTPSSLLDAVPGATSVLEAIDRRPWSNRVSSGRTVGLIL